MTLSEITSQIKELEKRFKPIRANFKVDKLKKEIADLEEKTKDPKLWDDPNQAQKILRQLGDRQSDLNTVDEFESKISQLLELSRMIGKDKEDEQMVKDLAEETKQLAESLRKLEMRLFLSGKYDRNDALLSIHAGQGGTEAMDWSSMLQRMYMRYGQNKGWKVEVLDLIPGDEAGVKSVTLKISGLSLIHI